MMLSTVTIAMATRMNTQAGIAGKRGLQVDADDEVVDHRQEQVIEQQ